jgi:hypothetical protein
VQLLTSTATSDNFLVLTVVPVKTSRRSTFAPTAEGVALVLTDPDHPLEVSSDNGINGTVPLYDPAVDAAPPTMQEFPVLVVTIINSELRAALPLESIDSESVTQSLRNYVDSAFGYGDQILRGSYAVCAFAVPFQS